MASPNASNTQAGFTIPSASMGSVTVTFSAHWHNTLIRGGAMLVVVISLLLVVSVVADGSENHFMTRRKE
jgi:hypothetical protein